LKQSIAWHLADQASTLAFADAFRAIMLAFLVATLLVPLMRKVAPRSQLPLLRPKNGSDADTLLTERSQTRCSLELVWTSAGKDALLCSSAG
jgi:hypothetical protein